ncbi:MAG TPA: CheR family methyltransferase [Candidatus Baltobacteraceae bacterium]|nr:CheR family methyltransferase [Candidatus Baltobacteraceae bacterium]
MVEDVTAGIAAPALNLRREELADIELQLLLDALLRYGACDFRSFNHTVLRRRVADAMRATGTTSISGLLERLLHDEGLFAAFVLSMAGGESQLFSDATFFRSFRVHVVPLLQTYSFIRLWVPCAGTGADAYALAALLDEAGILGRTIIYATCMNEVSVAVAKSTGYKHAGGTHFEAAARVAGIEGPLSDYFDISADQATPNQRLRDAVMLARHNPASDGSINEFHAIVSRGLLPLLNRATQFRFHGLLFESMMHLGFLALGSGETLAASTHEAAFRQVASDQPIFRRLR